MTVSLIYNKFNFMHIGFGNGVFFRMQSTSNDRYSKECINLFKIPGVNAIELHCVNEETVEYLVSNDIDLSHFSFVSLHAPNLAYDNDSISNKVLTNLELLHKKYRINNFIFHSDKIRNWEIISKYENLPVSIENMDDCKSFGRTVEEIESIMSKYNFNLTLDLQHCFVNDRSLKLALDFQNKYKDRIVEYHISGYDETHLHYPLFKTRQDSIIHSLKYRNVPIIIESAFDAFDEYTEELKYIANGINLNAL